MHSRCMCRCNKIVFFSSFFIDTISRLSILSPVTLYELLQGSSRLVIRASGVISFRSLIFLNKLRYHMTNVHTLSENLNSKKKLKF